MALNVKVAMLICTGFISGLCWLVTRVDLPSAGGPAVAAERAALPGAVASKPPAGSSAYAGEPVRPVDVAGSFDRGNPFDVQAVANRAQEARVAAAPVPAPTPRGTVLPPLARPEVIVPTFAAVAPESSDASAGSSDAAPSLEDSGTAHGDDAPRADRVAAAPRAAADANPVTFRTYKVQKNDCLARLARQQYESSDARLRQLLIEANPKLRKRPNRLLIGEELMIPDAAVAARVLHGEKPAVALKPVREPPHQLAALPPADPAVAKPASPSRPVSPPAGDKVAVKTLTLADAAKPGPRPVLAQPAGDTSKRTEAAKSNETAKLRWYTIRANDTLNGIAARLLNDGKRWREIAEINGLDQPDKILPGRRIRLPETEAAPHG
jgi:nucleoid-associated protein YgaU